MQEKEVTGTAAPALAHHRGEEEGTGIATTSPKAEKRIPSAWNENHEISFWQEPECD